MSRCPGGWWGRHKFEPRYDLGASKWQPESYVGFRAHEHTEAYREKTYVCDICVRCGETIKRLDRFNQITPNQAGS